MSNWQPASSTKSRTPQPNTQRAGPQTVRTSSTLSTNFSDKNVAPISGQNPPHQTAATNANVDNEKDIEKVGGSSGPGSHGHGDPRSGNNNSSTDPGTGYPFVPITSDEQDDDNEKQPLSHKIFDAITRHAGSRYVLLATIVLLLVWVVLGGVFGATDIWQIVMQNLSSIQVYLTDILLIRQHHTSSRSLLKTLSKMQARDRTYARLVDKIPQEQLEAMEKNGAVQSTEVTTLADLIPEENYSSKSKKIFDEACRIIAMGLGSVYAYIIYWIGIFIWIGLGKLSNFSDDWQLYINTAVAVALTFTSIFLQNRQQQQEDVLDRALGYIQNIESEIEFRLRDITGDREPNDLVMIQPPKVGLINQFVDWFAVMMGSFVGVIITIIFLIIWVAVGPKLEFDANWWLIIGTFTGLIGFVDGFVLRNIYAREADIVNHELEISAAADTKVFSQLGLEYNMEPERKLNWSSRVSRRVGDWCAWPSVCLASFLFVVALLVIATAMKWTTTAQLLCNTPTMIIEGFLLLVLIEAHCIADEVKGRHLHGTLERRLMLNRFLREGMVEAQRRPDEVVSVGMKWPIDSQAVEYPASYEKS